MFSGTKSRIEGIISYTFSSVVFASPSPAFLGYKERMLSSK